MSYNNYQGSAVWFGLTVKCRTHEAKISNWWSATYCCRIRI